MRLAISPARKCRYASGLYLPGADFNAKSPLNLSGLFSVTSLPDYDEKSTYVLLVGVGVLAANERQGPNQTRFGDSIAVFNS